MLAWFLFLTLVYMVTGIIGVWVVLGLGCALLVLAVIGWLVGR